VVASEPKVIGIDTKYELFGSAIHIKLCRVIHTDRASRGGLINEKVCAVGALYRAELAMHGC
jgi:hypothetical protein